MSLSRKQRRVLVNEASAHFRKKGISPEIQDVKLVLFIRRLVKILEHRNNQNRSSDAAREAHHILDLSLLNNQPTEPLDCQKGCSYCCHNFVSASAPQVFRIARSLRDTMDVASKLEKIRTVDDQTRGVDRAHRYLSRQPCALLEDGVCSVYQYRPTACRGMASHDVTTCERRVDGIHTCDAYGLIRGLADFAFMAALKICELPLEAYELNHAVRVALEDPDAEQRWLGGEDVFHDVLKDAWVDAPGISSSDFLDALVDATRGNAMDILDFRLP